MPSWLPRRSRQRWRKTVRASAAFASMTLEDLAVPLTAHLLLVHAAMATTISGVRRQAALVRALLDELDRALPADLEAGLGAQLGEELARLGGRCLEVAARGPMEASQR